MRSMAGQAGLTFVVAIAIMFAGCATPTATTPPVVDSNPPGGEKPDVTATSQGDEPQPEVVADPEVPKTEETVSDEESDLAETEGTSEDDETAEGTLGDDAAEAAEEEIGNNPPRFAYRARSISPPPGFAAFHESEEYTQRAPVRGNLDLSTYFVDEEDTDLSVELIIENSDGEIVTECSDMICGIGPLLGGQDYTITITATDSGGLKSGYRYEYATAPPIVLIHGLKGGSHEWTTMSARLAAAGFAVLDFTEITGDKMWRKPGADYSGPLALDWNPDEDESYIEEAAAEYVSEAIDDALLEAGYSEEDQEIDIIAHSMGGLVSRMLIENAGNDETEYEFEYELACQDEGLYCDGIEWSVDDKWEDRVSKLIMIGTPNHGSNGSYACEADSGRAEWDSFWGSSPAWIDSSEYWLDACNEMMPEWTFTQTVLGFDSMDFGDYYTIGGNLYSSPNEPNDGIVTARSPSLPGVPHWVFPVCHNDIDWQPAGCGHAGSELGNLAIFDLVKAILSGNEPASHDTG